MAEFEVWKNNTQGLHGVVKLDRQGNLVHEMIASGKSVQITRDERIMNQERAANLKLDVFSNGTLTPVRILDEADQREFASNPNMMTDSDLKVLFKLNTNTFKARIASIDNVYTLNHLLQLSEDESLSVTVAKLKAINDRLVEVSPTAATAVTQTQLPGAPANSSFY